MKNKLGNILGILSILSVVLYSVFFSLSRKQFTETLLIYSLLFLCLTGLYLVSKISFERNQSFLKKSWKNRFFKSDVLLAVFVIGLAFRLTLMTYTPNLSQDFFRFIWDGHQLLNGYNPYLYLPDEVIKNGSSHIPNAPLLYANMGDISSGNYTNYPPMNQLFFAAAAFLGGKSITATILWMRVFIILADVGIFFTGIKMLRFLKKPPLLIILYYLNPFIIIELTGNLHWEGMMAFFMLLGMYHLLAAQRVKSALYLSLGILLKLLPVMVLPLLLRRLKMKRAVLYHVIVGAVVVVGFAPFLSSELIEKYSSSVGLWFGKFEFNASVYYVIRAIGFEVTGYNIIETAGKILPLITLVSVFMMALYRKNEKANVLLTSVLFSYFIYLMLSTTVHPWYLTIPLLFSIFTKYRFMMVWSVSVFLSYYTYGNDNFEENLWLVLLQYILVIIMVIFELFFKKNRTEQRIR